MLARSLPESTEEWIEQLKTGDRNDPQLWLKILQSVDKPSRYAIKDGAIHVEGQLLLHPRKLDDLLQDGLLTRVLERVPGPSADLAKDPGAKLIREYGLRFDADVQERAKLEQTGGVTAEMIESSHLQPAKAAAIAYVEWLEKNAPDLLGKNPGTPQKINHAQFFLETVTKHEAKEDLFRDVARRYAELSKASQAPLEGQPRLPVGADLPFPAAVELIKQDAAKLNFVSPSAAMYHAAKHWRDLFTTAAQKLQTPDKPLREAIGPGQVDDYVRRAREVIETGAPKRGAQDQRGVGYRIEFEAAGLLAIVTIRPEGTAVIASAHRRGGDATDGVAPLPAFAATQRLVPYLPGTDEQAALWAALNPLVKQSNFPRLMNSEDGVTLDKSPATVLHFDLLSAQPSRNVNITVTLGPETKLVSTNGDDVTVALRLTYLTDGQPTTPKPNPKDEIKAPAVLAVLQPALEQFMTGKDREQKAILAELKQLKSEAETTWNNVSRLANPPAAVVKDALRKREAFELAFQQHVRGAADGGQGLSKALGEDVQLAADKTFDPLRRQITAEQTSATHAKGRGTRGSVVTPQLVEHLLFPEAGPGGGGIAGGHLDANLKIFLAANPRYSVVERLQARFGNVTLRLYDQYFWDGKINAKTPPPAHDDAAKRPSKDRDLAARWTKASTPKTTADSIEFYLEQGEDAFVRAALADPDLLKLKKGSFGATQKGATTATTASNGGPPEFSAHVGYTGDTPFLKTLYLSIDWLQRHSVPEQAIKLTS